MEDEANTEKTSTSPEVDPASSCEIALNDSGTGAIGDTPLTQGCSGFDPTPESMGAMAALGAKASAQEAVRFFNDPIDIRRSLIARRLRSGAETADGHTCSNIIEILENLYGYTRPAWAKHEFQTLHWSLNRQIQRLEQHSSR